MKIKVSDLEANPYRNIKKYPLDAGKIRDLKTSIQENGFWGGLLVRKHKGAYQLAFGHHRLQAIMELGIKEVPECIVYDLSEDDMLHRMFAENHETWGMRPACVLENVEGAKKRLTVILESLTWNRLGQTSRPLWTDETAFLDAKHKGAGRGTILKYLGNLYTERQVKDALAILGEPEGSISVKAAKQLPTLSHVKHFDVAIKKYEIPKQKHEAIAKQVVREGVGRRGVEDIVAEHALPKIQKKVKLADKKSIPTLDKFVEALLGPMRKVQHDLIKIKPNINDIQSPKVRRQFLRECSDLMKVLHEIKENENVKKTV